MTQQTRMRHCFNCGCKLGYYSDYDPLDTCGKNECEREARYAGAQCVEAREQLDRDMVNTSSRVYRR